MTSLQNNRDVSLDALKMVLICLVIYAHIPLLDGFLHGQSIECNAFMWHSVKGIYAFHMPLFVLLSGYFTKRKPLKLQFNSSVKLLRLFVTFHCIDLLLQCCKDGVLPTFHDLIYPSFALWYLLCLFYWRMLVAVLSDRFNRNSLIFASLVASLLVGFVPIKGEMGFQRFFSFMPYFFIGHYHGKDMMEFIRVVSKKITPHIASVSIGNIGFDNPCII